MGFRPPNSPSNVHIVDNKDNTITLTANAGAPGDSYTNTNGVNFYIYLGTSYVGNNTNYDYLLFGADSYHGTGCSSGAKVTFSISKEDAKKYLNDNNQMEIAIAATSVDSDGLESAFVGTSYAYLTFTWHCNAINIPKFRNLSYKTEILGSEFDYSISWERPKTEADAINTLTGYDISVYNIDTQSIIFSQRLNRRSVAHTFNEEIFETNNQYYIFLKALGEFPGFDSPTAISNKIFVKEIKSFPSFELNVVPGAVPSINNTFINIGSGCILKLFWDTPVAENNILSEYFLIIHLNWKDAENKNQSTIIFNDSIGNVNSFYLHSEMLSQLISEASITNLPNSFTLNFAISAHSCYYSSGNALYDSSTDISVNICKGCGIYTKVSEGYEQPIMKRAVAFARTATKLENIYIPLQDTDDNTLIDINNDQLIVINDDFKWRLMEEFYLKNPSGSWKQSDIRYEILVDSAGSIVRNTDNEPIYVL